LIVSSITLKEKSSETGRENYGEGLRVRSSFLFGVDSDISTSYDGRRDFSFHETNCKQNLRDQHWEIYWPKLWLWVGKLFPNLNVQFSFKISWFCLLVNENDHYFSNTPLTFIFIENVYYPYHSIMEQLKISCNVVSICILKVSSRQKSYSSNFP
jgi:hypothetical protein